jgi:hypothetical protein
MHQLEQILTAIDVDLDLELRVARQCEAHVARISNVHDRIGVLPYTAGVELRLRKAGRILLHIGGRDLLERVADELADRNRVHGDSHQRRRILRRVWGLTKEHVPQKTKPAA